MKFIYSRYIVILLFQFVFIQAIAQNVPDGTTVPGPPTNNLTKPAVPGIYNKYAHNFIRTWVPAMRQTGVQSYGRTSYPGVLSMQTQYFNGWGQTIQSIARNAGGVNTADLITPLNVIPSLSSSSFLPYPAASMSLFSQDPFGDQYLYYISNANGYSDEMGTAHSRTKTEVANGIVYSKSFAPGYNRTGSNRGNVAYNLFNTHNAPDPASSSIRMWQLESSLPSSSDYYNDNELTVRISEGQNDKVLREYYDKDEKLVCKQVLFTKSSNPSNNVYLTTYYVYDNLSRLAYIITPKASEVVAASTWLPFSFAANDPVLNNLCYHYVYDNYGSLIEQKLPDQQGVQSFVYDKKRRQVLFQSPLMKTNHQWQFTIYDNFSRVVMQGTVNSIATREDWQNWVNSLSNPPSNSSTAGEFLLNYIKSDHYYLDHNFSGYPGTLLGPPDVQNGAYNSCSIDVYNYYDLYDKHPDLQGRYYDSSLRNDFSADYFHIKPLASAFANGLLTGSRVRIKDNGITNNFNNQWISSVYFYDEQGRLIQTQTKNPWTDNAATWDVNSVQYTYSGLKAMEFLQHYYKTSPQNTGTQKYYTLLEKSYVYDFPSNRLLCVKQRTDNAGVWRDIAAYTYDALGNVSKKVLGGGVEQQNYAHNIRGELTAINSDYTDNGPSATNPNITFGCKLNYDFGFTDKRYDGTISGMMWRGSGGNERAYGYKYNPAGMIAAADFREFSGSQWKKTASDYSVSNIVYDANGNLQSLKQMGMYNNSQIVEMDRLRYTYNSNSNLLDNVYDTISNNYNLHDFLDKGHTGSGDYTYDDDGNLSADANKGITTIIYNNQDLPVEVDVAGGKTIKNIYDGSGDLIQKTINDGSTTVTYSYFGPFVYKNDVLEYFLHDEGRCRWLTDSNFFKYDYFVKDHLGNVRSVLTAHPVYASNDRITRYNTGFELVSASTDGVIFTGLDDLRDFKPLGSPGDVMAGRLNGEEDDHRTGAAVLLHVMSGDKFNASAYGYYESDSGANMYATSQSTFESLVNSLTNGIANIPGGENGGNAQQVINGLFQAGNVNTYLDVLGANTDSSVYSRTYLCYMMYDEGMQLLPDQSGAVQLKGAVNQWNQMELPQDISVTQNGYLAVYLVNLRPANVWVDNIRLSHYVGALLEEQHYYPHGLHIDAGGQQNTPLANRYLYQGKLLQTDLGMDLYDFHAREYDAQIGRFSGVDPASQFPSGYTGMANDPANVIDPTGMKGEWRAEDNGYTPMPTAMGCFSFDDGVDNREILYIRRKNSADNVWLNGYSWSPETLKKISEENKTNANQRSAAGTVLDKAADESSNGQKKITMINNAGYAIVKGENGSYTVIKRNQSYDNCPTCEPFTVGESIDVTLTVVAPFLPIGMLLRALPYATAAGMEGVTLVKTEEILTKSSLSLGREIHRQYKAGQADEISTFKEYRRIDGVRPDFVDFKTKTIFELKPNNPRSIKAGYRQLERYQQIFEKHFNYKWKTVLETY